jgi:hypothetical protein
MIRPMNEKSVEISEKVLYWYCLGRTEESSTIAKGSPGFELETFRMQVRISRHTETCKRSLLGYFNDAVLTKDIHRRTK